MLLPLANPWGVNLTLLTSGVREPHLGGNKYHKLTGYLAEAKARRLNRLITVTGAHSNHLRAFAALARRENIAATAIIRGEELSDPVRQSEEIRFALAQGVHCHFVSRAVYRELRTARLEKCQNLVPGVNFADALFIPEGGRGVPGITGVVHWAKAAAEFSEIWLPVATGTTAAGFLAGTRAPRVAGVQVLRNTPEILGTIRALVPGEAARLSLIDTATRFRFGHPSAELTQVARRFSNDWGIAIDAEYMARVLYAFEIHMQAEPAQGRVLLVYTFNS